MRERPFHTFSLALQCVDPLRICTPADKKNRPTTTCKNQETMRNSNDELAVSMRGSFQSARTTPPYPRQRPGVTRYSRPRRSSRSAHATPIQVH